MNVVIIGGTGLIGQHAAMALLDRGHDVTLVGRRRPEAMLSGLEDERVRFVALDAWAAPDDALAELFVGHDACVYALGPDDRAAHPAPAEPYLQANLVGQTERILTAARDAGVQRAVVLGSYFAAWDRMHPELMFAATHPYVRARLDQARRAVAAGRGRAAGGMDVCILEIPYVFGTVPGQVPFWKDWIFERLRAMPVAMYPVGGTSAVTARQVGQAAAAAVEVGEHDARYPLADEQLTWDAMLRIILPALGKRPLVIGVPRLLTEPAAWGLKRDFARQGLEAGVDARYLMRHIMYQYLFVDAAESQRVLGYERGGVREAIVESVAASY